MSTISSICSRVCSGGTPKSTESSYYGGAIPWLNTKEIDFNVIESTEKTITEAGLNNSSAKWVEAPCVIVAMYGATAGRVAISNIRLTTNQACCNLNIDPEKADYRFVYYALKNDFTRLSSMANGGAQQNLNAQQIKDFDIPDFSLSEQKKIAAILSSLDEKIETNRKINARLEELAQALFKSWFIDFEPFGGKMPKDWETLSLNEMVERIVSGDWGKEEMTGNFTKKVLCIRGADLNNIRSGEKVKAPVRYILEKNFKQKMLSHHDLIVEISGGSPTQSTGRIAMISSVFANDNENSLICTNFCKALKIKEPYSHYFYYLWNYLYDNKIMFIYENGSNGLKNLNLTNLLERELCIIPTEEAAVDFYNVIEPIFLKMQRTGAESARLAFLRDTLLPKLMSGELIPE